MYIAHDVIPRVHVSSSSICTSSNVLLFLAFAQFLPVKSDGLVRHELVLYVFRD